jgi:hypothetical protein
VYEMLFINHNSRHGDVRECKAMSDGLKTYRKICTEVSRSSRRDNDGIIMIIIIIIIICVQLKAINISYNHNFILSHYPEARLNFIFG